MRPLALTCLFTALAATACSARPMGAMAPSSYASGGAQPSMPRTESAPADEAPLREAPSPQAPGAPPPPPERALMGIDRAADKPATVEARSPMLIYVGTLHIAVLDTQASLAEAEKLATDLGGYLARRDDRTITVRVPAGRFSEAVTRASKLGDVLHRDVSAQDVTEEFADLEVRMKNARAVRDRLEQLLAKATTIQDSINLEKELARVTGELERFEGRMKLLRDRAAFSTLTLRFEPRPTDVVQGAPKKPHLPFPWVDSLGLGKLLSL